MNKTQRNKRKKGGKRSPKKEDSQKDQEMSHEELAAAAKAAGIDMNNVNADELLKNAASMMQGGGLPGMPGMGGDDEGHKLNKQEKKARKTIQKLGMKLQKGFTRVTIKKSKNVCFHPDVCGVQGLIDGR